MSDTFSLPARFRPPGFRRMSGRLAPLLAAALCAAFVAEARAGQTGRGTPPPSVTSERPEFLKLDEAERELVRGSRAAVIAAGFTPAYFDRHFELFRVVNRPGDRRVVWRFRAAGHETYLADSVGSYADEQGRPRNTHSVSSTLGAARDIRPAVTRRRAERLMRACIGDFEGGAVALQPFGPRARTALVFTAASVPPHAPAAPPAAGQQVEDEPGRDRIRRGRRRSPTIYLGAVDLETGRCVKGRAQAGAPRREDSR